MENIASSGRSEKRELFPVAEILLSGPSVLNFRFFHSINKGGCKKARGNTLTFGTITKVLVLGKDNSLKPVFKSASPKK